MSNKRRSQASTPVIVSKNNLKQTDKRLPNEKQKEQNNEYLPILNGFPIQQKSRGRP